MNKTLNTLLATTLLATAGQAFAASSTTLTVTGVITPSSCTPQLSSGGKVDYEKISAKDLNVDTPTSLPAKTLQLTVTCDAATLMAIEAKDNREGSGNNNDTMEFGLGLINGSEKLGNMTLRLLAPIADTVQARTIGSYDGGSTWFLERFLMRDNILSVANASTIAPIPVQAFSADLYVEPQIAPANQLTLTNEVSIDGSVTLTVKYL